MVAALNAPQYDADIGGSCGGCILVTGAKGSLVVRVVDRCPVCAHGDVDLSEEAFPYIDDMGLFYFLIICLTLARGRVPISWKYVPCPDSFVHGNINYLFQAGSTVDWFTLQVCTCVVQVLMDR
jgi:expansin (peptidoglycan-binding protein)